MSYLKTLCDEPLVNVTLGQLLDDTAARWPGKEAYVFRKQGVRMTYAEVKQEADRLAAGLMSIGVRRGDVVAWVMSTRPEFVALCFALAKIGAVAVPLTPLYFWSSYKDVISKVMAKIEVKIFLIENFPSTEDFEGTLPFLRKAFPTSNKTKNLTTDTIPSLRSIVIIGDKNHDDAFQNLEDIQSLGTDEAARGRVQEALSQVDCHDTVILALTSGSSGLPKCVEHSSFSIVNNTRLHMRAIGMDTRKSVLLPTDLPEFPLAFPAPFIAGFTLVFPSNEFPTMTEIFEAITEERCEATTLMYVRTLHELLHDPSGKEYDLSSLNQVKVGGNVVTKQLVRRAAEVLPGVEILKNYGITETLSLTVTSREMTTEQLESTVGNLLPHTEMKLVDGRGQTVPLQHEGEVWVRGYFVFKCYRGDDEKTAEVKTADGWYKTGDIGILEENGLLKITGRKEQFIIKDSTNVHPTMVEQVLLTHPKVFDVKVVGVPDPASVEEICACIILKKDQTSNLQEMREFSEIHGLVDDFCPEYVIFMDSFPLTSSGQKVDRKKLRDVAIEKLALQK
ncbi:PREDICTED: acyl-CoA synthetase family member 2, mitochondrial-like [Branchiostoma belcheri]|uniref:Acyl-CoA synthetase family member 2, mitochondrial-like n=1 Tax=Branchiostoma belcheri TaxID=7741 RepID=A0A6P5AE02_BRABE|nr:PREDICTED: acyl-CoA synthetase family member 2, mitochondrial-like [Branchiostoma belcheri]